MQILIDEITLDPLGRGYVGMTDQQVADSLNEVNRTRNRSSMTASEVIESLNETEYLALTADKRSDFWGLLGSAPHDPFGFAATVMTDIFGGGSVTLSNLSTLRVEAVSRGVELGIGFVGEGDVWDVRNG